MSSDVIIGPDGKPRCAWAGTGDTAAIRYHDEVWGTRTYDESAMFEALTLGVFEVGLSWSIVFGKREAFRRAFFDFNVAQVAAMTQQDVSQLMQDASIIRNQRKIQATIDNAGAMLLLPRGRLLTPLPPCRRCGRYPGLWCQCGSRAAAHRLYRTLFHDREGFLS